VSSATNAQSLNRAWHRAAPLFTSKRLAWLVIGFGVVLRGAQYFSNSALYVDEGALALNIINRTIAELVKPLDFNQAAPTGFLLLEKIAVLAFGDSEYALRLVPFLFSLAAMILFYTVARRVLVAWAVPVALLFFAVSEQVIYFATQVKQYSSDVAITLLVVLVGLHTESKELTPRRSAILALTGIIVVWLSHPSVFVLASVGTTLMLLALKRKQWPRFWKSAACCALWVLSFAAFYLVSLSNLTANQRLEASWMNKGTFMPLPPTSLADLGWFVRMYFSMFSNPGDSPFPIAAGLVFIVGCIALFKKRKAHLAMLLSPILFTLLASGLHKYPFGRRLLLFSIPLILITIVAGVEFIVERARPYSVLVGLLILEALLFQLISGGAALPSLKRSLFFGALTGLMIIAAAVLYVMNKSKQYATVLGSVILVFLLLQPVGGVTNQLLHPPAREDIRPVMSYIEEHWQPGDVAYVYHHLRAAFQYYALRYVFNPNDYVLGKDEREHWENQENEAYVKDLDQLRGKRRIWFVFSYVRSIKGVNEEEYLVQNLDSIGKRGDQFSGIGASVYLYDLSYQRQ
jgi:uncharacterized membrane protein